MKRKGISGGFLRPSIDDLFAGKVVSFVASTPGFLSISLGEEISRDAFYAVERSRMRASEGESVGGGEDFCRRRTERRRRLSIININCFFSLFSSVAPEGWLLLNQL